MTSLGMRAETFGWRRDIWIEQIINARDVMMAFSQLLTSSLLAPEVKGPDPRMGGLRVLGSY